MLTMNVFIPTNEANEKLANLGYSFKPFIIEAYQYHLDLSTSENTQNLFSRKVNIGTVMTNKGKTRDE